VIKTEEEIAIFFLEKNRDCSEKEPSTSNMDVKRTT
jgi:hypothetical protein